MFWVYGRGNLNKSAKIHFVVILSGDFDWDTLKRVERGIELNRLYKDSKIVICGKHKRSLMQNTLRRFKVKNIIVQDKSTNTFQDALFLKKILKKKMKFPIVLITSSPHLKRSIHTFQRVFRDKRIFTFSTNDFLNLYSPLLPTGWLAVLINMFKDFKYNGKII